MGINEIDCSGLPASLQGGVKRYIGQRQTPGHFLTAVICNDLQGAVGHADNINRANLVNIVVWFYNEAPSKCWGSLEKMNAWLNSTGENNGDD